MPNNKNYYEILGVSQDATFIEIQKKYRELVKKYHPDLCKEEDKTIFEEKVKEINVAYDILSDSKKRAIYDKNLKEGNNPNTTEVEEEYDYEKSQKEYTEQEKEFAKKIALEKITESTLLKISLIKNTKYEIIKSTFTNPHITDDIYLDKITEWWTITEEYTNELKELKEKAKLENIPHMIDPINETINSVNDELREVPLSVLDAKHDIESKEKKEKLLANINKDMNLYKEKLNNKYEYYELIDSGIVNESNYDRFRQKTTQELKTIKNKLEMMQKAASLYNLGDDLETQLKYLISKVDWKSALLPKEFSKAYYNAVIKLYEKESSQLGEKVHKLADKMQGMVLNMGIRPGNIVTLTELNELKEEYKTLKEDLVKLKEKKEKHNIQGDYAFTLVNELNLDELYNDTVKYREKHIEQFFDIFNLSIKRRHLANVMLKDNALLTGACLMNGFGTGVSIICKNYQNLTIPTFTILTGLNIVSAKQKQKIYQSNYDKCINIFNNSEETKEEYKQYCLKKNIKNKSTF